MFKEKQFVIIPLSQEELEVVSQQKLTQIVKPLYAPAIVKAWFRAHELQIVSAEDLSAKLSINVKQIRCIVQRLVAEKWLFRTISNWKKKTNYYFFSDQTRK